jgi:hypothetical protein
MICKLCCNQLQHLYVLAQHLRARLEAYQTRSSALRWVCFESNTLEIVGLKCKLWAKKFYGIGRRSIESKLKTISNIFQKLLLKRPHNIQRIDTQVNDEKM